MNILKDKLLEALDIVKPGLATTELIEQSTSFAFIKDRVVTYNDSISISHFIPGLDITGAIRAEELYGFLRKTKNKELSIELRENEIVFKTGKSMIGLLLQSKIELPLHEIEGEKDWMDLPSEFINNLNFVKDSTSRDMSRRILTCVHVSESFMEASDGFQLIRYYEEGFPFPSVLIPVENIPDIIKIAPAQIAQTSNWLHFRCLNGTELSCRTLADSYPETSNLLVVEGVDLVFPETMSAVLERAMVFTKQDNQLDEYMEIKLKENAAMVQGKNEYGWFKEKVKVKYTEKPCSFVITPSLLQNILKRSTSCILGSRKIRFEGVGWEYVAVLRQG